MIIISKFRDYYDSVSAYGQDSTLYYQRKSKQSAVPDKYYSIVTAIKTPRDHRMPNAWGIKHIMVGFCGHIYPCIQITTNIGDTQRVTNVYYCYSVKDVDRIYKKEKLKKQRADFHKYRKTVTFSTPWHYSNVDNYFKASYDALGLNELFIESKVPVFIIEREGHYPPEWSLTLNPCLKDIEFYRVTNSFSAFQAVDMYLSGVLGTNAPVTVDIADEYRIAGHGYNKQSFRTVAPGKKAKRRRKKS